MPKQKRNKNGQFIKPATPIESEPLFLRLPKGAITEIRAAAMHSGLSISELMALAIAAYLPSISTAPQPVQSAASKPKFDFNGPARSPGTADYRW